MNLIALLFVNINYRLSKTFPIYFNEIRFSHLVKLLRVVHQGEVQISLGDSFGNTDLDYEQPDSQEMMASAPASQNTTASKKRD